MYYVKTYYAFEILGSKEFWATYESYNGCTVGGSGCATLVPVAGVPSMS